MNTAPNGFGRFNAHLECGGHCSILSTFCQIQSHEYPNSNRGIIFLLFLVASFLWWPTNKDRALMNQDEQTTQSRKSPAISSLPPLTDTTITPPSDPMQALMKTPINFYGIVLDQYGTPVPTAKVAVSVVDNMNKASPLNTISDGAGKFTVRSKGLSMRIEITKTGYYYVDPGGELKPSIQGFDFGADPGRGINKSDSSSPIFFIFERLGIPSLWSGFLPSRKCHVTEPRLRSFFPRQVSLLCRSVAELWRIALKHPTHHMIGAAKLRSTAEEYKLSTMTSILLLLIVATLLHL